MARDELPYTPAFDALVQGFQDRTFKNASHEQVFDAIIKYTRSSGNAPTPQPPGSLTDEQLKQLKAVLFCATSWAARSCPTATSSRSRGEFSKQAGAGLSEHDFWRAITSLQGAKAAAPPTRKKVAAPAAEEEDDGEQRVRCTAGAKP